MSDNAALREHLSDVLKGLKDKTIDLDRAKAINETAQTLINLAKVEVDFMKVSGSKISNGMFSPLPGTSKSSERTPTGTKHIEQVPGGSITTHRID